MRAGPDGLQSMTQQVADHFAADHPPVSRRTGRCCSRSSAVGTAVTAMSGLRIGLVCPYSFDRPGGVQNHVLGLAHACAALGHQPADPGPR